MRRRIATGVSARFIRYLKPYRWHLVLVFFCGIIVALCTVTIPILIAILIGILSGEGFVKTLSGFTETLPWFLASFFERAFEFLEGLTIGDFNLLVLISLTIGGVSAICDYGQVYIASLVGGRVITKIRVETFDHLLSLPSRFYTDARTGEIVSRVTNDVSQLQGFINDGRSITSLVKDPCVAIGALIVIFYLNWELSVLSIIVGIVAALIISRFGRRVQEASSKIQSGMADVASLIEESVRGVRVVKMFSIEASKSTEFRQENAGYLKSFMKSVRLTAAQTPVVEFITILLLALVMWYIKFEMNLGGLSVQKIVVFIFQLGNIAASVKNLSYTSTLLRRSMGAAARVFETLEEESEPKETEGLPSLPCLRGEIHLKDVSFCYRDGEMVLRSVNLKVEAGETVAIVGSSGAGKSTLVDLILRLYDVAGGAIYIDGHDIRQFRLDSLRRQIGMVPQEPVLFSGTVADNIRYGKEDAAMGEVVEAAKIANAHDFIMALPMGYDTHIGEKGAKLSGGERQRIAIARAVIRKPAILILDEATSSLDAQSERAIQESIFRLVGKQTTLIIAHRLSTVAAVDKIAVLEGGGIVQMAPHRELILQEGPYKNLFEFQFRNIGVYT